MVPSPPCDDIDQPLALSTPFGFQANGAEQKQASDDGGVRSAKLVGVAQPGLISGSRGSGAVLEAPAPVVGLDDIAVVGEPVEERGGHLGVEANELATTKGRKVGHWLTGNVVLQLFDDEFLVADDALHQVTYRDNPNQLFLVENGKMPHRFVGHDGHAFFDRLLRSCIDNAR